MGWPEETTLNSSMAYIETAYRGRMKMLAAIFGGSKTEETAPAEDVTQTLTPQLFDALFIGEGVR